MTEHQNSDTQILDPQSPDPNVDPVDDGGQVVSDAIAVIDGALAKMMQRDLVSSGEVADLLLDLRTLLTAA